jgi:hypothetical protein
MSIVLIELFVIYNSAPIQTPSSPRKRGSICFFGQSKMDSRFRGNDGGKGVVLS